MSFLDNRQRAMLAEMGVRVWAPTPMKQREPANEIPQSPAEESMRVNHVTRPSAPAEHASTLNRTAPVGQIATPLPPPLVTSSPNRSVETVSAANAVAASVEGVGLMDWRQLETAVSGCQACGLCAGRTNTVFGVGSKQAEWMVIGEAPGENEDQQGEPFVGQAGKLLDNMLAAIGLSRSAGEAGDALSEPQAAERQPPLKSVYIANVLKCRPPGNRNPQPSEIAQCEPYLRRQVALLRPKVILAMGRFAVQSILQTGEPIGRLRGRVHQYEGVPVVVTYHPAYLLRALPDKSKAWDDLCLALEVMQGRT